MADKSGSEKWKGKKGARGREIARRNAQERKLARIAAQNAVPF